MYVMYVSVYYKCSTIVIVSVYTRSTIEDVTTFNFIIQVYTITMVINYRLQIVHVQ